MQEATQSPEVYIIKEDSPKIANYTLKKFKTHVAMEK